MKRLFVNILLLSLCTSIGYGQNPNNPMDSNGVVTNSFWDNWYGQVGVDMWLQNPYGSNFKNVFPNGKTFGVDVALGKITPEFGIRGNFTGKTASSRITMPAGFMRAACAIWYLQGTSW